MNDIGPAIYAHVTADATVAALIGDRLYAEYDRQADRVYPLAVYTADISPQQAFDGPPGIESATVRIAAVATTYKEATLVADALKGCMEGESGTWGTLVVQGVFLQADGIKDDIVTEPTTEEILFYVKELTFDVVYSD